MTDRKFFSGLPDKMMTPKNSRGPNRQQTNFYWPNETDLEEFVPSRNRMRNRSMSTASLMSQSQASSDTEESRRRRTQQNRSKIEFYDMADIGTDAESVYSRANDPMVKRKRQDSLKSKIEFYDFVDTRSYQPDDDAQSVVERPVKVIVEPSAPEPMTSPENGTKGEDKLKAQVKSEQNLAQSVQNLSLEPKYGYGPSENKNGYGPPEPRSIYGASERSRKNASQYVDSFSESDEDERYYPSRPLEDRRHIPPPPHRYPPSQRSVRSNPRRVNAEYLDFDDDEYDRQYDSRRLRYRKSENVPRMARRRDYSPELSDEDFYDHTDGYRRGGGDYFRARLPPAPERYRSNASRLDETESYYRGRNNRRPGNGYASEADHQRPPPSPRVSPQENTAASPENGLENGAPNKMPASARPPVKPLSRTQSINEARQRHHVNLKSNIFHNDPEYNQIVEQRKPVSVRDFAARQRVGVGLPDI